VPAVLEVAGVDRAHRELASRDPDHARGRRPGAAAELGTVGANAVSEEAAAATTGAGMAGAAGTAERPRMAQVPVPAAATRAATIIPTRRRSRLNSNPNIDPRTITVQIRGPRTSL
jgi:hypothetical protein